MRSIPLRIWRSLLPVSGPWDNVKKAVGIGRTGGFFVDLPGLRLYNEGITKTGGKTTKREVDIMIFYGIFGEKCCFCNISAKAVYFQKRLCYNEYEICFGHQSKN